MGYVPPPIKGYPVRPPFPGSDSKAAREHYIREAVACFEGKRDFDERTLPFFAVSDASEVFEKRIEAALNETRSILDRTWGTGLGYTQSLITGKPMEQPNSDIRQVIVVRKDLNMRKGKMAAQVAHAAMAFLVDKLHSVTEDGPEFRVLLSSHQEEWLFGLHTKICVGVDSEEELKEVMHKATVAGLPVYPVTDAGLTEFHGEPTLTCAAIGPAPKDRFEDITGHLKLL